MSDKSLDVAGDWSGRTIIGVPFEQSKQLLPLVLDQSDPRQLGEAAVKRDIFKVRLADTEGRRNSASLLINRMYSWRGYDTSATLDERPNRITLVASSENVPIGTITLNFDSPDGLPADDIYKDQLDYLRSMGRLLVEPTKLAIEKEIRSKRVIATLFNMSYIYARNILGYTDFILEVNPRHAGFYESMLGSAIVGEQRNCPRVNAPAILLRLDIDHMTKQIERFGGRPDQASAERSLYPYFFSNKEEDGITRRLRER